MRPVMLTHIDEFLGFGGAAESGLTHGLRLSHKGDHRTVGGFSGIHVQHLDAFYGPDGGYNGLYYAFISSFAIIGDALDELFHGLSFNASPKLAKLLHSAKPET